MAERAAHWGRLVENVKKRGYLSPLFLSEQR